MKSRKPDTKKPVDPKNVLATELPKDTTREQHMAQLAFAPALTNANTARTFARGSFGELDLTASLDAMVEKIAAVQKGNLGNVEATLTAQAVTLDAIFNELARRSALNMGEYLHTSELYMRLALKAQSQCRATLETLAEIKNPRPLAFVKQANIAQGPQQVNNGAASELPRAREDGIEQTKLLENNPGERLDIGAQAQGRNCDPPLEAMAAINGAKDA